MREWRARGGNVFVWFVPASESPYGATSEPIRPDAPTVDAIAAVGAEHPLPYPPRPLPPVDPRDEAIKQLTAERDDYKARIDAARRVLDAD